MSSPFAAYGEAYQSFKCEGNNVNINSIEQIKQRQIENNNNFDATANSQQQVTPTGAEEEPLNELTGNSNGNDNGEPLLNLKNVCLNFGINENSGLITSEPQPPTCEECFTILSETQLEDLFPIVEPVFQGLVIETLEGLCNLLEDLTRDQDKERLYIILSNALRSTSTITLEQTTTILDCLLKLGLVIEPIRS